MPITPANIRPSNQELFVGLVRRARVLQRRPEEVRTIWVDPERAMPDFMQKEQREAAQKLQAAGFWHLEREILSSPTLMPSRPTSITASLARSSAAMSPAGEVGPIASALYQAGIQYCGNRLTDGFIPSGYVPFLLPPEWLARISVDGELVELKQLIEQLLQVQLWHVVDGGYVIHDYLDPAPKVLSLPACDEAALGAAATTWR